MAHIKNKPLLHGLGGDLPLQRPLVKTLKTIPPNLTPPNSIDGINPDDPGMRLLARHLGIQSSNERILLVHCGEIANLNASTARIILDIREGNQSHYVCVPPTLSGAFDPSHHSESSLWSIAALWPRAHLGKDFTFSCLAQSGLLLVDSGQIFCSIRKQKGAKSLSTFMRELFGTVQVIDRDQGYQLLHSQRDSNFDQRLALQCIEKRYLIEAPELLGLSLRSAPGVFSSKELDQGTQALLRWVHRGQFDATMSRGNPCILDLCAGIGTLGLVAKKRWPQSKLLAIESNILASKLIDQNAQFLEMSKDTTICNSDGLQGAFADPNSVQFQGNCRLALINPPTHAPIEELRQLLGDLPRWMEPGGQALLVVCRPGTVTQVLSETGARVEVLTPSEDTMTILKASWP